MKVRSISAAFLAAFSACHSFPEKPSEAPSVEVEILAPGVWKHTSHSVIAPEVSSNGLVVQQGDHLLLVDTAWGEPQTAALLVKIQSEIGLPVRTAVITHAHSDRLAGVNVLRRAGISVLASPLTRNRARQFGLPVPKGVLGGLAAPHASVALGNVEVIFPGAGHSPDNLVVWVSEQRVLFGGCAVRALAASLGPLEDADPRSWRRSVYFLQQRFRAAEVVVVPGHGDPGSIALLRHTEELLARHSVTN